MYGKKLANNPSRYIFLQKKKENDYFSLAFLEIMPLGKNFFVRKHNVKLNTVFVFQKETEKYGNKYKTGKWRKLVLIILIEFFKS